MRKLKLLKPNKLTQSSNHQTALVNFPLHLIILNKDDAY